MMGVEYEPQMAVTFGKEDSFDLQSCPKRLARMSLLGELHSAGILFSCQKIMAKDCPVEAQFRGRPKSPVV